MSNANSITEEFIRNFAVNASALNNAKKISSSGGFKKLCKSEDEKLIFGDCYGSGSKPYNASVDFSGDAPVFRCSCPSRQIPCKHCLAIMFDWLAGNVLKRLHQVKQKLLQSQISPQPQRNSKSSARVLTSLTAS